MVMLLAFMFGVIALSVWEVKGGPRWRLGVVIASCMVVAAAFMSLRAV